MSQFLLEHLPGCTPATPCSSCEALAFLPHHLTPEQFNAFIEILKKDTFVPASSALLERTWDGVLELSTRIRVALETDNKFTLGDIVRMTKSEFLRTPNIGKLSVSELEAELAKHGLRFGMGKT